MAHFHTNFYFFLFLVILFSSTQIQARLVRLYDELPKLPFQSPSPSPVINEISLPPSGISPSPSPAIEAEFSPSPSPVFDKFSPSPSPDFDAEISPPPSPLFEGGISEAPVESETAPTPVETIDNAYGLYGSSDLSNEVFNKKTTEKSSNNVVVDVDEEHEIYDDVPANAVNNESFREVNNYNPNGYNNLPSNNNGGVKYDVPANDFNTESFREVNNYNPNGYNNLPSNTNGVFGGNYNDNNGGVSFDVPANDFNTESFKEVNNYSPKGYNNLPSNNNGVFGENYSGNNNGGVKYDAVPVSNYNNRGFNDKYNGNGFEGSQGTSDTRFMENGNNYYDVQNENKSQNDGYGSVNRDVNNGGRYFGDRTKYEFDSMDEYEREQGYPTDQKDYVP